MIEAVQEVRIGKESCQTLSDYRKPNVPTVTLSHLEELSEGEQWRRQPKQWSGRYL